jgi:hypothetical protein
VDGGGTAGLSDIRLLEVVGLPARLEPDDPDHPLVLDRVLHEPDMAGLEDVQRPPHVREEHQPRLRQDRQCAIDELELGLQLFVSGSEPTLARCPDAATWSLDPHS